MDTRVSLLIYILKLNIYAPLTNPYGKMVCFKNLLINWYWIKIIKFNVLNLIRQYPPLLLLRITTRVVSYMNLQLRRMH